MDGETAAGKQVLQRIVGGQRAADPLGAQTTQLVRLVDELRAGLPRQAVECGHKVAGRNADLPYRVGLCMGGQRKRAGESEQGGTERTDHGYPLPRVEARSGAID